MKKTIAVIMGGYSSEIEISLKSGNVAYENINKEKYEVYIVHILENKWVAIVDDTEYPINKHDFSFNLNGSNITFDCVFNAIHGEPGEDGTIVAYFDLIGIKHTSAPFYPMALTFNKRDTLSVVKEYGINVATSFYLDKGNAIDEDKIIAKVGLPCFVKPNKAGSSFGISKVYKKDNLLSAIQKAFVEDDEILIEAFLDGTEVSIGIIKYNNDIKVLPPTEIVSENDFFDYDAKYLGKSEEITPARISSIQLSNLNTVAKKIYELLKLDGFSRAEYIFIGDTPYFIEINTVPGLTTESLLPQQAREAGISLESLFDSAIEASLNA